MKKFISMFTVAMFAVTGLVACGGTEQPKTETPQTEASKSTTGVKVGMMTDSGTIDDKSFNQGTWEGIQKYAADHSDAETKYVQPAGETKEDYLNAADNLIMAGNQLVVAPGYKFEQAIGELQTANPDVKFVILDGQPSVGKDYVEIQENTVAIYFAEHEAGFLAGVTAALQSQTGKVGFIGGMKIPAVERFGWGYVAGVAYANATYGTEVEVADYLYNGTFTDAAGGQTQAGGMYDKGIDIIFVAAGGVGNGVIAEAKTRAEAGEETYVIGVDVDQYEEGLISNGQSVILTSAVKYIDNAAYDMIDALVNGTFPGGQVITMDAQSNGIGLPAENPNLTEETVSKTDEVFKLIKAGTIVVPSSLEELTANLEEIGFDVSNISFE